MPVMRWDLVRDFLRSHTPDEYVDLPEVTAARRFYATVARDYLDRGDR